MRIILDFDYTLFDTFRFRQAIKAAFINNGIDSDFFENAREESRGGGQDWKPAGVFDIVESSHPFKMSDIKRDFDKIVESASDFLYKDTLEFLEKIYESNSLFMVSYGEDSFQNNKISSCVIIKKYFTEIIVTKNIRKDAEARDLARGERAIFADDNPLALSSVKSLSPQIVTIRVNRGDGRYAQEESGEGIDFEVKDLRGVEKIISKNR
jgi:FMN phosphatase YigB (HAD superfamily)